MFAVEKIVLQIGAALDDLLGSVPVQFLTVACAALSVVTFVIQILYILHSAKNIKNYRRIKRFVVSRGDIDLSNSHRFYKKCVKHMPRSIRKAWKNHALIGSEYAGSELQFKMNRLLTAEKRPMVFYYYVAFACVAALQTLLLCKGVEWTIAVCYAALTAAVWAAVGLVARLYAYLTYKRERRAAAGILRVFENRLTLEDKSRARVFVVGAKDLDGIRRACDLPASTATEDLAKAVGAYVDANPSKDVAKVVESGIAVAVSGTDPDAEGGASLKEAAEALKKYTA